MGLTCNAIRRRFHTGFHNAKKETAGGGEDVPVPSVPNPAAGPLLADSAEWLRVTLSCIGEGVITTDPKGCVTFLNPTAHALTGWTLEEATAGGGVPIRTVFNIINETSRTTVESPTVRMLHDGVIVGLANHTILVARDGTERNIDDSAAPIRNANGETAGAVLVFRDVTERKRQEQLAQGAFDYATNILDTQREPFLVLDKDLRVVSANRSFYKSFRVEKDATQGRFVYDLGDGQWNIPALRELLEDVLPQDHAFEGFEVEHDFPSGVRPKTMLINARRIRKPGDDSELILLAIEEITERKKSEQALLASRARFETLFDSSPVGMHMLDADFRLRNMSTQTRAIFGSIKDLMGRDFAEVVHILWPPQVADDILARFRHTLATGECYKSPEFSAERFDHKVREYCDWQIHRIAMLDGRNGLVCYFLDISARVLAQQSLRDSEVRYRRVFETAKDGILILDAHTGEVTDANAFMCGLTGLEKCDILGKELYQIGMYKDIEENKAAFCELQRTGYLRHEHLPVHNQRGEKVEVEFVANVYLEGDRLVAQCNVRDISERVQLQRKVVQQADALAAQARAKDEFLAMLSHELRNPLAPIRAAAHMMRLQERGGGAPGNPILQEAREVIERRVANLTKMVSDLSEVSRVISGRIRLDLQDVDMKLVVEHAVQSVAPRFEQRTHAVSVSACSEPVWAHVDPTRLEEILVNLLNNAGKYTPDGGRIAVAC